MKKQLRIWRRAQGKSVYLPTVCTRNIFVSLFLLLVVILLHKIIPTFLFHQIYSHV